MTYLDRERAEHGMLMLRRSETDHSSLFSHYAVFGWKIYTDRFRSNNNKKILLDKGVFS